MNQSNLLIRNVAVTYGRMLLTVGIGLYSTRLLFLALTDTDIGIFNVLGTSVALIEIIRQSLTVSAMRHLSISVGMGDKKLFARTINTTYGLFLATAVCVYLTGLLATPLVNLLNIPDDRREVAFWVYQFALLSITRATLLAPIDAVLVSKQAMVLQAIIRLPDSLIMLAVTSLLFVLPGDRLMNFVVMLFVGQTTMCVVTAGVCFWLFPESRPRRSLFDRSMIRELSHFAGWTALGGMTWAMRMRGSSIALNVFFGPVLNAAWDASNRVCGYHSSVTGGVMNATTPAIVTAEGAGRRHQAARLTLIGSKYTTLAALFVTAPLLLDAQNAVTVWLKNPPEYAVTFICFLVASLTVDALGKGFGPAMQATNQIGALMRKVVPYTLLPLPLACLGFWLGAGPTLVVLLILAMSVTLVLIQAFFVGPRIGFTIREWLTTVVYPALAVCVIGVACALPARFLLSDGLLRFILVTASYAIAALPAIWYIAMPAVDQGRVIAFIEKLRSINERAST